MSHSSNSVTGYHTGSSSDCSDESYEREQNGRCRYPVSAVRPVDYVDFSKLEGYHPTAFVKSSLAAREMQSIAQMRRVRRDDFEDLDYHIWAYANDKENNQSKEMFEIKKKAVREIQSLLHSYDPDQSFHICGSTMNELGTNDSDVDVCWRIPVYSNGDKNSKPTFPLVKTDYFDPVKILETAREALKERCRPYYVSLRPNARVPILCFTVVVDDVKVRIDLNINNITGIYNTFMLAHYAKIDIRFPILAKLVRVWGKKAEIIDPANGYLNSYTVTLMLLHFLQCGVSKPILPNLIALRFDLFNGTLDLKTLEASYDLDLNIQMEEYNDTPIGDLLIGFIRYFGFFSYQNDGISIRLASVNEKTTNDKFFLEEVYDGITVPKNLNRNSLKYIKASFLDTYSVFVNDPNFHEFINNKKVFLTNY